MVNRPDAFPTARGFAWYPEDATSVIQVTRMANVNGTAVVGVHSTYDGGDGRGPRLQISVSPGGRSIRAWLDGVRLVPEGGR